MSRSKRAEARSRDFSPRPRAVVRTTGTARRGYVLDFSTQVGSARPPPRRAVRGRGHQLAPWPTHHSMPMFVASRSAVTAGALVTYSDDRSKSLRQFGAYVAGFSRPISRPTPQLFMVGQENS
jgi:hypothetical protein